jgi:hypothetical protein
MSKSNVSLPVVLYRGSLSDDTTSAFGFEMETNAKTQCDSANGMNVSEERLFRQTNWLRDSIFHERKEKEKFLSGGDQSMVSLFCGRNI